MRSSTVAKEKKNWALEFTAVGHLASYLNFLIPGFLSGDCDS